MCGILTLVRPTAGFGPTEPLVSATSVVRHRGPDDEGYLLWRPGGRARLFAGDDTTAESRELLNLELLPAVADWQVAFGHRRLSILDLSPGGHQPAVHTRTGLAVTYNGEIYNYLELRRELEALGREFCTDSDTEVLLASWAEWGAACLDRFNGMFAFVLLDPREGKLHAVRDRFGVKPLYLARVGGVLAFVSECKQIRALPGFSFRLDESSAIDYLAHGIHDHTRYTFHAGVEQVLGGEHVIVDLDAPEPQAVTRRWYSPKHERWRGSDADARAQFRALLTDSVRLRLRADVPVGSCLSGGLDSSAIVCLARQALDGRDDAEHAQVTVTACFDEQQYDEWRYATLVAEQADVSAVRVYPSLQRLRIELDRMLWHLDEPFGSTSQFSQWCVFASAAGAGLTVMLDGQGSDEQLAGYHGSTRIAHLAGLLRRGDLFSAGSEIAAAVRNGTRSAAAQVLLAARDAVPGMTYVMPRRFRGVPEIPAWLRLQAPSRLEPTAPHDLGESLRRQTLSTSLPALLRYEDRNSMAWSIEARVPFLDYRLVEFVAGLPDRLKLHRGRSKVVLRDALAGVLPEAVRQRQDKMGFVTPEETWLREPSQPWLRDGVAAAAAAAAPLFDVDRVTRLTDDIVSRRAPFSFAPWRILCFGRWMSTMGDDSAAPFAHNRPSAAVVRA